MNITDTLIAKSDQLNADDLIAGPIDVVIERVTAGSADQPVDVHLVGRSGRPWRPCKTMRRLLAGAWGPETDVWIGRAMRLYRDPAVTFGSDAVGGIRVSHLSHLPDREFRVALATKRGGKKAMVSVMRLDAPASAPSLDEVMTDLELSPDEVSAWLVADGKPALSELSPAQSSRLASVLPERADLIRARRG